MLLWFVDTKLQHRVGKYQKFGPRSFPIHPCNLLKISGLKKQFLKVFPSADNQQVTSVGGAILGNMV